MYVLAQNAQIEEGDSLEKALEFIPVDYTTMTNMLTQHLQSKLMLSVKDEEMSIADDEEEKER